MQPSRGVSVTPLMLAAGAGHLRVVEALLAGGADVDARGSDGATAVEVAERWGAGEVAERLRAAGAARHGVAPELTEQA